MEKKVKVAILGAGSAGLYALGQVRKNTDAYLLVNGGPLGTTCARVGCMPSKQIIVLADHYSRLGQYNSAGIPVRAGKARIPQILRHVRKYRDGFVKELEQSTRALGDKFIEGYARFVDEGLLEVEGTRIQAERVIIATGSGPVVPDAWRRFGDRIITSDTLYEMEDLPGVMAVIGLGAIGLEMAVTFSRLGIEVIGIDLLYTVAGMQDPVVAAETVDIVRRHFEVWLGEEPQLQEGDNGKIIIRAGEKSREVDAVFVSLGRRPNLDFLGLERLGVSLDARGVPDYDPATMQIRGLPLFIAGDATGDRAVLHEAADEGRIAGYNSVRSEPTAFTRKPSLLIIFTHPDIAVIGTSWDDLDREHTAIGDCWLRSSGRAVLMEEEEGIVRIYADSKDGRILGGSLVASQGEHLAHLLAWAVMEGFTVERMLSLPYYHPCIEETFGTALKHLQSSLPFSGPEMPSLRKI